MFITFWKLFFYTHNEGIGPDQRLTSCALGNASCLGSPLMGTKEIWEEAGQASLPLHQPEQHHLRTCLIFCVFKHKFPWEKEKAFATHTKKWGTVLLLNIGGSSQANQAIKWNKSQPGCKGKSKTINLFLQMTWSYTYKILRNPLPLQKKLLELIN